MALYAFITELNTVIMSPFVTTFPRNSALLTAVISAQLIQKCSSQCSRINNCGLKNWLSLQSLQAVRPFRYPQLQHYPLNTYNCSSEWNLGIC